MNKKLMFSTGILLILLLIIVVVVNADISFLTSDGVWGYIDDGFDGVRKDVVGVVGVDPGFAWSNGSKTTQNATLIRNPAVCTGDFDGDSTLAEWNSISPPDYSNLGSHTITIDYDVCPYYGMFISEYIEGVFGNNNAADAIEIYNNMGEDIVFAECPYWIGIFAEGNDRPTTLIPLTGTIAAGGTYVVASVNISGVTEDLVNPALSFSGDDAVALIDQYVLDDDGEQDGADDNDWSGGPSSTSATPLGTAGLTVSTDPTIQLLDLTDWNQVRYGEPASSQNGWPGQSGLAFLGTDNTLTYGEEVPFLVGKFCHVNNPIYASNMLRSVPLEVSLFNMDCGPTAVEPFPPPKLTFMYPASLDETTNSLPCDYPSDTPCSDRVDFGQSTSCFQCYYQGDVVVRYTVALVGFMHLDSAEGSCEDVVFNSEDADGTFISQEGTTNCGCLFAMVTEANPTAVELKSFNAFSTDLGIELVWETASEIDNLGFNIYRANRLYGTKTKINPEFIESLSPGGTAGARYAYLDKTTIGGYAYFYWLEDIESGENRSALNGPAIGISAAPSWRYFLPVLTASGTTGLR